MIVHWKEIPTWTALDDGSYNVTISVVGTTPVVTAGVIWQFQDPGSTPFTKTLDNSVQWLMQSAETIAAQVYQQSGTFWFDNDFWTPSDPAIFQTQIKNWILTDIKDNYPNWTTVNVLFCNYIDPDLLDRFYFVFVYPGNDGTVI
jgi:hypothetical protein